MKVALYIYVQEEYDPSLELVVDRFKERVEDDGGVFEAGTCLQNTILSLGGVYGIGLNTITDFSKRVLADSGTFESENCLLQNINSLSGVAPASAFRNVVKRIELFEDEKISVTSSIQNINDISKVFTDYSQSFTVPASAVNNEIFKHWYENAVDNGFDQRLRYDGYIEIDTQVFRTGKWQIESASVKNNRIEDYKLTFYGNLKSLSDKFGELKLKDLNTLNDYSITYSGTEVENLIESSTSENIMFPLISSNRVWQYGTGGNTDISQNSHHIHHTELFPAVKLKTIFNAIEDKFNITFAGSFLQDPRFTEAFLWFKNKDVFNIYGERKQLFFNNIANNSQSLTVFNDSFQFEPINDNSTDTFWNSGSINISLSASCDWIISYVSSTGTTITGTGTGNSIVFGMPSNGTWKVYLSTSQSVTYSGTIISIDTQYDNSNNSSINNDSTATIISASTNTILDLQALAPDIKITDFFSGVLKMFNLTAYSYDENLYTLQQLENWYYDGSIKDFSQYCITDFDYERIKAFKKVTFEYEKSESFLNRKYTDFNNKEYGFLDATFDNDGSDYSIKLPFEHLLFQKFTGNNVQVGYSLNNQYNPYIPKPVILYRLKNETSNVSFYFNNGITTNQITNYNVFGADVLRNNDYHTTNWGVEFSTYTLNTINNTLFKNYYYDYLNNLYSKKSRMVKVTMRLPYSEMLNLRLNDRIIIRDKRYIINQYTTDLDTFESKFELIQDFRTLTEPNTFGITTDNASGLRNIYYNKTSNLTWSIGNNTANVIKTLTDNDGYLTVDLNANSTGSSRTASIISSNNDLILITQNG